MIHAGIYGKPAPKKGRGKGYVVEVSKSDEPSSQGDQLSKILKMLTALHSIQNSPLPRLLKEDLLTRMKIESAKELDGLYYLDESDASSIPHLSTDKSSSYRCVDKRIAQICI